MSLILAESFDGPLVGAKWTAFNGGTVTASGKHNNGLTSMPAVSDTSSSGSYKNLTAAEQDDVLIVSLWWRRNTSSVGHGLMTLSGDAGATNHLLFEWNVDNGLMNLRVRRGGTAGTIILDTGSQLNFGTWYFIEIKAKLADSGGTIEIWINGVLRGNYTGDTKNAGTAVVFDRVTFWGSTTNTIIDGIAILNEQGAAPWNAPIGRVLADLSFGTIIRSKLPTGNGNSSQGVGSDLNSTDNYLLVNENPYVNDSTYVDYSVDGDKDTYVFADITDTEGGPVGIQISSRGNWLVAASDKAFVARLAGVEEDSPDIAVANTVGYAHHAFVTKPGGAFSWSIADFNAAEFGTKKRPV